MRPFVVAAFRNRPAAEKALESLRASGIDVREARLHGSSSDASNAVALQADEVISGGLFANLAELFDQLLGTRHDADRAADYDEMVRREATLLSVGLASAESAREVTALLESAGAERVSTLPQRGLES